MKRPLYADAPRASALFFDAAKAVFSRHAYTAVGAVLLLSSCVRQPTEVETSSPAVRVYEIGYDNDINRAVREFRLDDGTRCVVVQEAGIDCEWRRAN